MGILALLYGGFSYVQRTHATRVGPIEVAVEHRRVVDVPVWAGVAAIVVGGALLVWGTRGRPSSI